MGSTDDITFAIMFTYGSHSELPSVVLFVQVYPLADSRSHTEFVIAFAWYCVNISAALTLTCQSTRLCPCECKHSVAASVYLCERFPN